MKASFCTMQKAKILPVLKSSRICRRALNCTSLCFPRNTKFYSFPFHPWFRQKAIHFVSPSFSGCLFISGKISALAVNLLPAREFFDERDVFRLRISLPGRGAKASRSFGFFPARFFMQKGTSFPCAFSFA